MPGHVRSTQRNACFRDSYVRLPTPRGSHAIYPHDASSPRPVSPRAARAQLQFVEDGYPSLDGYPAQPESSRWPLRDDRFDCSPEALHTRAATPRPNFSSLVYDESAWTGGQLSSLRGGKCFTLPTQTRYDFDYESQLASRPQTSLGRATYLQAIADGHSFLHDAHHLRPPLSSHRDVRSPNLPNSRRPPWGKRSRAPFAQPSKFTSPRAVASFEDLEAMLEAIHRPVTATTASIQRLHTSRIRARAVGSPRNWP